MKTLKLQNYFMKVNMDALLFKSLFKQILLIMVINKVNNMVILSVSKNFYLLYLTYI